MSVEELPCVNHPRRTTRVRCSSCESPICVDCMRPSSVAMKCPACAAVPRSARRIGRPIHKVYAIGAGLGTATLIGALIAGLRFSFFLLPMLAGYLIGQSVSRASRRQSHTPIKVIAAVTTAVGFVLGPLLLQLLQGAPVAFAPQIAVAIARAQAFTILLAAFMAAVSVGR